MLNSRNEPCSTATQQMSPVSTPQTRADLQRRAPAEPARQHADRQRPHPHAEHEDADRQRREPLVGREHRADDAGGRHQHRVVAAGERLRHRQHQRIAPRQAVAGRQRPRPVRQWPTSRSPKGIRLERNALLAAGCGNRYCGSADQSCTARVAAAAACNGAAATSNCARNRTRRDGGSPPSARPADCARRSGRRRPSSRRS